jgi:hypothetical protein
MAIELNPDCQKRLRSFLIESFSKIRVWNGCLLDLSSTVVLSAGDKILPSSGAIKKELEKYFDEGSVVYDFVNWYLTSKLVE